MNQLCKTRFGELLGKIVPLSLHDVEEILNEQACSHKRFGEIALSMGLCQPQHVWHAWASQLGEQTAHIDLDQTGIDGQAVGQLSRKLALKYNAIPVRIIDNQMVIAVADNQPMHATLELSNLLGKEVRFTHADPVQVRLAIEKHYPLPD